MMSEEKESLGGGDEGAGVGVGESEVLGEGVSGGEGAGAGERVGGGAPEESEGGGAGESEREGVGESEGEGDGGGAGESEREGVGAGEELEVDDSDEIVEEGLSRGHLKGLLEALIFVADKPVTLNELVRATDADRGVIRALLDELSADYEGRGIALQQIANGYIFRTNAKFAPFLRERAARRPVRMTRTQLETLAIVAYRQPLTRPDIDEVRGVDSGAVLRMLLERNFIRILGKKDEPGRPLLYGTTSHFLEFFGLKSLRDLPTLRELTELTEESRRVLERELGELEELDADVGEGEGPREGEGADGGEEEGDGESSGEGEEREGGDEGEGGGEEESEGVGEGAGEGVDEGESAPESGVGED